jgi:hypothetical protein
LEQHHAISPGVPPKPQLDLKKPVFGNSWAPWNLRSQKTAAALIALLVAFTFNLDQPYWALLTVFIVSQPQQSGLVLAKSFYRIIGTSDGKSPHIRGQRSGDQRAGDQIHDPRRGPPAFTSPP